jgi:putative hemolysin
VGNIGWLLLGCGILALGTLFFSASAVALRIFSRAKLAEAFRAKNKEALAEKLADSSENLVLTCFLYRLVFNTGIIILLIELFIILRQGPLQILDYILIFVIAMALFSIFSVAIPHAWAKYSGERLLSGTYPLLMFSTMVAFPMLYVFHLLYGLIRRLAGVARATPEEQQEEKQEEFLNGLEQQKMEGVVDEEEQEMIENVLELSETTADEIMTPRTDIVAIEVNSDLRTVVETINKAGHTRVPVYEENIDHIIGFVYAKDLLTEIGKDPAHFKLREKMREAYFVPETKPLRVLLHEFQNRKLHIAVVLDEYGGTAGIVTLEDILEELVGEISDEYEQTSAEPVKKLDDNTIEVDARTYVDDLNDEFELDLPEEEDYDTIGGFVFSHLGYIPKTGKSFKYRNLKFTIVAAEARKIGRVRIQILEPEESPRA